MNGEKQPNSLDCFVCGINNPIGLKLAFYQTGPKEVTAKITVQQQFQGFPGIVHGGIVAAMLDEAASRAHFGNDNTRMMFTAKLELRYRKNVPIGEELRIVGYAGKVKQRVVTSNAKIMGPNNEVLAEAEAIFVDVPDDTLQAADLDSLGWKVYPD